MPQISVNIPRSRWCGCFWNRKRVPVDDRVRDELIGARNGLSAAIGPLETRERNAQKAVDYSTYLSAFCVGVLEAFRSSYNATEELNPETNARLQLVEVLIPLVTAAVHLIVKHIIRKGAVEDREQAEADLQTVMTAIDKLDEPLASTASTGVTSIPRLSPPLGATLAGAGPSTS